MLVAIATSASRNPKCSRTRGLKVLSNSLIELRRNRSHVFADDVAVSGLPIAEIDSSNKHL